jgi:hypothetical protein
LILCYPASRVLNLFSPAILILYSPASRVPIPFPAIFSLFLPGYDVTVVMYTHIMVACCYLEQKAWRGNYLSLQQKSVNHSFIDQRDGEFGKWGFGLFLIVFFSCRKVSLSICQINLVYVSNYIHVL